MNKYYERYFLVKVGKGSSLESGEVTDGLTAKHKMQIIKRFVEKHCKTKKPIVIDFGGVYGSMAFFKKEFNATVISVNVSENQLNDCECRVVADITEELWFEDSIADIVLCLDTLEHLIEPDKALENAKRILKPNGFLIITKPNLASLPNRISLLFGFMPTNYCPTEKRLGTLFGDKNSSWHKTVLTPIALIKLLKEHGFETKEFQGFSYSYNKTIQFANALLPSSMREGICLIAKKETVKKK